MVQEGQSGGLRFSALRGGSGLNVSRRASGSNGCPGSNKTVRARVNQLSKLLLRVIESLQRIIPLSLNFVQTMRVDYPLPQLVRVISKRFLGRLQCEERSLTFLKGGFYIRRHGIGDFKLPRGGSSFLAHTKDEQVIVPMLRSKPINPAQSMV